MRQFFAYCEPNEPIYLGEERILTLQPNSSITQQTDSGYDDDNQPLESTLCSSWSDGQRYFSSMKSLHGGLKTDKIHPLAQCKCSRLGTSSLLKFRCFWVIFGTYTISDATKKNLRSSNSDRDFIRNSLRCFACIWQSKIFSKELMAILGDIWKLALDSETG